MSQSGTFNANATVQALADAVAMDPALKGVIYSRILEESSMQYNAFERFTSAVNPRSQLAGGIRSIFAKKSDLAAGGGDTVKFNVIGPPGGPGVKGSQELTGNTSQSLMATYGVTVDWHRDGFELTRDQIEFLSAGRSLVETTTGLLAQKMGLLKQNHQMMRLIADANGNIFRPNHRTSTAALLATDTLTLSTAIDARARARTKGAQPLFHKVDGAGSPVDGYLIFASDQAMRSIRNSSDFQSAVINADNRGESNAMFSGELLKWQGMPWFEFPIVDMPWDDYIGSPILGYATLGVAFGAASAVGNCKLKGSATNTKSLYFQWFDGYDYLFTAAQTPVADSGEYYAWIVNPAGSVGFVAYTGSGNNGNQITVTKILSKNGTGVSTLGATTVGNLVVNTNANPDAWTNAGDLNNGTATIPITGPNGDWVYTDEFAVGARIIQANANGVPYGRSFVFGAMASCFANGRIAMSGIEQTRDFGFTVGKGFETIFGTGLTLNPNKVPVGYLLVEHAVDHEGYPVPSYTATTAEGN